jgi:hypothetical protein
LDLGKVEIPKEHVANLLTMQSGRGQPAPDSIELDLQDSGGTTKAKALGQQFESHKNFFLGTSKVEESSSTTAGKGFATGSAEKESGLASASGSVGSIGDHIAKILFAMVFTFGVRTCDIQIFRLRTTFSPRPLSHPFLLSKERIA